MSGNAEDLEIKVNIVAPYQDVLKSFETVKSMLRARGYDIGALEQHSPEDVVRMAQEDNIFHLTVEDGFYLVYFTFSETIKNNDFANIRKTLNAADPSLEGEYKVLLITKNQVKPSALKNFNEQFKNSQIFEMSSLLFDISKHALVPKHEVLSPADKEATMKRLGVSNIAKLPHIHRDDPMAKYLDIKAGELVKITRASVSSGESVFYRVCV